MTIDQLKDRIPDFAKNVRLNLASMMAGRNAVITEQIRAIAVERDRDPQSESRRPQWKLPEAR